MMELLGVLKIMASDPCKKEPKGNIKIHLRLQNFNPSQNTDTLTENMPRSMAQDIFGKLDTYLQRLI